MPRVLAISYTPSAVNSGQEIRPLKGLLTVGVERMIPLVHSKCDVVIFESITFSRDMT